MENVKRPYYYFILDMLLADGIALIEAIKETDDYMVDMDQMKMLEEKQNAI